MEYPEINGVPGNNGILGNNIYEAIYEMKSMRKLFFFLNNLQDWLENLAERKK